MPGQAAGKLARDCRLTDLGLALDAKRFVTARQPSLEGDRFEVGSRQAEKPSQRGRLGNLQRHLNGQIVALGDIVEHPLGGCHDQVAVDDLRGYRFEPEAAVGVGKIELAADLARELAVDLSPGLEQTRDGDLELAAQRDARSPLDVVHPAGQFDEWRLRRAGGDHDVSQGQDAGLAHQPGLSPHRPQFRQGPAGELRDGLGGLRSNFQFQVESLGGQAWVERDWSRPSRWRRIPGRRPTWSRF